jgi:hypothetical protein
LVHRMLIEKQSKNSRIILLPDSYFQICMFSSMSLLETIIQ